MRKASASNLAADATAIAMCPHYFSLPAALQLECCQNATKASLLCGGIKLLLSP